HVLRRVAETEIRTGCCDCWCGRDGEAVGTAPVTGVWICGRDGAQACCRGATYRDAGSELRRAVEGCRVDRYPDAGKGNSGAADEVGSSNDDRPTEPLRARRRTYGGDGGRRDCDGDAGAFGAGPVPDDRGDRVLPCTVGNTVFCARERGDRATAV